MPDIPEEKAWLHPIKNPRRGEQTQIVRTSSYAELQVTTNFSFLRGASHPEEMVARAAELGHRAVAVTDLNSLAGIVRAHIAAKESGMRFIVGARLTFLREIPQRTPIDDGMPPEVYSLSYESAHLPFSLLVYPTNRTSYGKLSALLTRGKRRAPKGCCFLLLKDLREFHEGLIAVIAPGYLFEPSLEQEIFKLREIFERDRISLALTHTYGPDGGRRLRLVTELSRRIDIPLVVTNDVHYHLPERRMLQDVLTCIRHGVTLEAAGFRLAPNAERHLKSGAEMAQLFRAYPSALRRTADIVERVEGFSLSELKYEYPHEVCLADSGESTPRKSAMEYLEEITWRGGAERYPGGVPEKVAAQIRHEFSLIRELDYPKYFLTVHDIVSFARAQGILCQGRGAAANSAVCYCLGITSVDPDRINLLFERFISKERNEPPDIDIDFEHERREEVIQYIYEKFGRDRAALVAEVITYRARSALRDIGKVFGLAVDTIEQLIRILSRVTDEVLLPEEFARFGLPSDDPTLLRTIQIAQTLIGFPRHLSQHVGGFIVSEEILSEFVPIENAAMKDRTVIEWDKDDVDSMGMLKIDVLALGMLTCIRKSIALINGERERRGEPTRLEFHTVPAEDRSVYDMICEADTLGVFQIESRAQMSMLPQLRPRSFYDLVIEVAIVRPGPIQGGMVHPYLRRRAGKEKVNYPNEKIERILGRTLGVPIFQEQAMELSIVAAGFSPGEADKLRRAMASWKRNKNLIRKFEDRIVRGMRENGYTEEFSRQVCNQIKGFGEYGFPQSHAASFALLVYVSCWLKKHEPAVFCAALINSQPLGFYQPAQIIQDAERHGVRVLPIDIHASTWDCSVSGNSVRLGMRMVRSLQKAEAEKVRECVCRHGPFKTIAELWRVSGVRVRSLRALAQADAFHPLGLTRQLALWELRKLHDEPLPLFDQAAGRREAEEHDLLPAPHPFSEVMRDYHSYGHSLRAHPIEFLREQLKARGVITAHEMREKSKDNQLVSVAGVVLVRQRPPTASGVVFLTLEDETGPANLIIWPQVYKRLRDTIYDSTFLLASGKAQRQDGLLHLIVEDAERLSMPEEEMIDLSRNFF